MEEDVDFDIETHVGEMAAAANSATASAAAATACPCSSFAAVRGPLLLPPSPPEAAGTFRLRRLRTTHTAVTSATKARQIPTAMPR